MSRLSHPSPHTPRATSSTRTRAVGAVGALSLALALGACGSTASSGDGQQGVMSGMTHGSTNGSTAQARATGRSGDVMFAQMMIPHHEQAVDMADLALARSPSSEVRRLAEQIKAAQSPEIALMKGWLGSWGASPDTTGTGGMDHGDGVMSAADMSSLRSATGATFDRLWLTMMIAHHQGAVTMAERVLGTTSDQAVVQLAKSIVSGQTAEIATMRGMLG